MSTNDTAAVDETNDAPVSDEDLRNLKYSDDGVETSQKDEDEPSDENEDDEADDDSEDEGAENSDQVDEDESDDDESEEQPSFVKEFPNIKGDTPEEYAKNLEIAYKNSTTEALRLKGLTEATTASSQPKIGDDEEDEEPAITPAQSLTDPTTLWVNSKIDKEIADAFDAFKDEYPQVSDPAQYEQFKTEVKTFAIAIKDSQGRMADPGELYQKAALSLGWEKASVPNAKEKLGMAMKQNAASSKVSSSGAKKTAKSKVTDAQIQVHRNVTGSTASDADIRKELEAYVT